MEPSSAEHHISGVYTKILIEFLVQTVPVDAIDELLAGAGETRSIDELADIGGWNSYAQFRRLLEERSRLDTSGLHEQTDLLSDWLRSEELAQAAQTLG